MEVKMIPIDKIRPAQFQPRELFDKEKIAELTESIKEMDLIAPIVVRKEGRYLPNYRLGSVDGGHGNPSDERKYLP